MTTPSGTISMGNVRTELGASGSIRMGQTSFREVANDLSGAVRMSRCRSKTRYIVTAATSGSFPNLVGFINASMGAISPASWSTLTFTHFYDDNGSGQFKIAGTPTGQSQSVFANVVVNNKSYNSSGATFNGNDPGGFSVWTFAGAAGLSNGSVYNAIFS